MDFTFKDCIFKDFLLCSKLSLLWSERAVDSLSIVLGPPFAQLAVFVNCVVSPKAADTGDTSHRGSGLSPPVLTWNRLHSCTLSTALLTSTFITGSHPRRPLVQSHPSSVSQASMEGDPQVCSARMDPFHPKLLLAMYPVHSTSSSHDLS